MLLTFGMLLGVGVLALASRGPRLSSSTPAVGSAAGSAAGSPSPAGFDCLPEPRQGMAAVHWNSSILLVGGSTSPGACKPPYTEHATIWRGSLDAASGHWVWRNFSSLRQGLTHAAAVAVGDTLYVMGGYGLGPCEHSPPYSKGKCAHSAVWAIDLLRPDLLAEKRAPMGWNRSNFGAVEFGGKIYTAGGYGNFGVLGGGGEGARVAGPPGPPECVQGNTDVYDPVADRWTALRPMPTARGALALGAVVTANRPGGVLFAVGGFHCVAGPSHTRSLATVESYDIAAGTWAAATPLPAVNALLVPVRLDNSSFLVVGGFNGTSGGDMRTEDLLLQIRKMSAHATSLQGSGAVANSWSQLAQMPNHRGFPAAALAGDAGTSGHGGRQLLAIGGYDAASKNDSSRVEAMDMATLHWSNCSSAGGGA